MESKFIVRCHEKEKTPEEKAAFDAYVSRQLGLMFYRIEEEKRKKNERKEID